MENDPSLSKIVILSAILHLLFVSLIAIPFTSREKELRSYFVNIVGPIETFSPEAPKARPDADVSLETARRASREIERLRTIEKLAALKSLKERQSVQIVEKEGAGKSFQRGIIGYGVGEVEDSYYRVITQRIWQEWFYPHFKTEGLEVIISIKIGRDGRIGETRIEKASGDIFFDRSAIKAITKASPLPPPPMEMEIGVRFYL